MADHVEVETMRQRSEVETIAGPMIGAEYTASDISLFPVPGMSAENVQEGIEELNSDVTELENVIFATPSWESVQSIVRSGRAKAFYPVGYEFSVTDSDTNQTLHWRVVAHDHHAAADSSLAHTMTLELKNVYSYSSGSYKPLQFDAPEAFYYAESGLNAGTYHFTVANQAWYAADNGKTFQFTLAKAVPAGGQLVLDMTNNATLEGKSVKSYSSARSTTVIETVTITLGSGGTNLGSTDGNGNMNHMHRNVFGSNNYAQSAVRQWLNSSASSGNIWWQKTKFDRPPSWMTSHNGFMHGLPSDFLAVVQPAVVPCRTNSVFETASLDGTVYAPNQFYDLTDTFFVLSRPEIYGNWDSADYKDGTQLEYYEGLTQAECIKRDAVGSARTDWLRSPNPGNASSERIIGIDGGLNNASTYYANGIAPACIIA